MAGARERSREIRRGEGEDPRANVGTSAYRNVPFAAEEELGQNMAAVSKPVRLCWCARSPLTPLATDEVGIYHAPRNREGGATPGERGRPRMARTRPTRSDRDAMTTCDPGMILRYVYGIDTRFSGPFITMRSLERSSSLRALPVSPTTTKRRDARRFRLDATRRLRASRATLTPPRRRRASPDRSADGSATIRTRMRTPHRRASAGA